MNPYTDKRRRFIKAGLTAPLLTYLPLHSTITQAFADGVFLVPDNIQEALFMIYGGQANAIAGTDRIELKAPDIAENAALVPMSVTGETGLISSLAVFVEQNPLPLAATCTFEAGSDLAVAFRLKVRETSSIYVIAQTGQGLIGVSKRVKITIGCGGG